MNTYTIRPLENSTLAIADAVNLLCSNCPNESERYEQNRLFSEIDMVQTPPFYKVFLGPMTMLMASLLVLEESNQRIGRPIPVSSI